MRVWVGEDRPGAGTIDRGDAARVERWVGPFAPGRMSRGSAWSHDGCSGGPGLGFRPEFDILIPTKYFPLGANELQFYVDISSDVGFSGRGDESDANYGFWLFLN